jgi:excisionase family DNA binding protein
VNANVVAGTFPVDAAGKRMAPNPIVLKIPEACLAARVGRTSLYNAIKRGELRALKRGKSTLILAEDLRLWIESLPVVERKQ